MKLSRLAAFTFLATVVLVVSPNFQPSHAQSPDTLRERYRIDLPPAIPVFSTSARVPPGSSSGSPTAFGPSLGDAFIGAGFQARTRYGSGSFREEVDGSLVAGFGLGDATDFVGVEIALSSFSTFDSGFLQRSGMSVKVHRILPGNVGIAVGAENVATRGFVDGNDTFYAVVSKVWPHGGMNPFESITTSFGVGNGRFRFERDVFADKEAVNPFGSIGIQLWHPFSVIADWSGQDLTIAASLVPFAGIPLIITPGLADITGTSGDGARFILGAGMGFNFIR